MTKFTIPDEKLLESLKDYVPPPRPVPLLGYACLNCTLSEIKPIKSRITTNRTCIQKTYKAKGLDYISELMLKNVTDLATIIQWNHENSIRLFRVSSGIFPWCSEYEFHELKDYELIKQKCKFAGDLAKKYDQRLTMHPSHFTCMASPKPEVVKKALRELEAHSDLFDLMGYEPSLWNKINIHIGGTYCDKPATIERFKQNFQLLSENCKKRLAIENDDKASEYCVDDLLPIVKSLGIGLTWDLHHQSFCNRDLGPKEAFLAAMETWGDVRPIIHWSECPEDPNKRRSAHSDYVTHLDLWGYETSVDIMIEAKAKELALLRYRDEIMPIDLGEKLKNMKIDDFR
jgi:UV DNA damage endonuclease